MIEPGGVEGRVSIVTGAARGIGGAIGKALLDEGAKVCFADLDVDRAGEVAKHNRARVGVSADAVRSADVDVRDRVQVRGMIAAAVAAFGRLDVMVNNACVNKPMNFLAVTVDMWHLMMDINGLDRLIGMQEAARQMIAQGGGGKIVNTASVASRQGFDKLAPYCASKWAVVSLTQSAARDLFLGAVLIVWLVMPRMVHGRNAYAIGDNRDAAVNAASGSGRLWWSISY